MVGQYDIPGSAFLYVTGCPVLQGENTLMPPKIVSSSPECICVQEKRLALHINIRDVDNRRF